MNFEHAILKSQYHSLFNKLLMIFCKSFRGRLDWYRLPHTLTLNFTSTFNDFLLFGPDFKF